MTQDENNDGNSSDDSKEIFLRTTSQNPLSSSLIPANSSDQDRVTIKKGCAEAGKDKSGIDLKTGNRLKGIISRTDSDFSGSVLPNETLFDVNSSGLPFTPRQLGITHSQTFGVSQATKLSGQSLSSKDSKLKSSSILHPSNENGISISYPITSEFVTSSYPVNNSSVTLDLNPGEPSNRDRREKPASSELRNTMSHGRNPQIPNELSNDLSCKLDQESNTQELVRLGNFFLSKNKGSEALRYFDRVLRIDPNQIEALSGRGGCLEQLGDFPGAIEMYDAALKESPTSVDAIFGLGRVYKTLGRLEEYLECGRRLVAVSPETLRHSEFYATGLNDLGSSLKKSGDSRGALRAYQQAVSVFPSYYIGWYNIGVVYGELGNLDEAMFNYKKAISLNPEYSEALCNIGVLCKMQNDIEGAIQYYEKSVAVNPNFGLARANLSVALCDYGTKLKNSGDNPGAVEMYKKSLYYNSSYAPAHYNLGVAYADSGCIESAMTSYELSLYFNPSSCEAWNNLGVLHRDNGNPNRAIECYNAVLSINPAFSQTLNNLGVMYTHSGDFISAVGCITAALKIDPTYAEAYNNLGVLYRDEGLVESAIQAYDSALCSPGGSKNASQNKLLALNYLPKYTSNPNYVFREASRWGVAWMSSFGSKSYDSWPRSLTRKVINTEARGGDRVVVEDDDELSLGIEWSRKLRVGYISPDFFTHSVSYFVESLLRFSDSSQIELFVYSNVVKPDAKTAHLMGINDKVVWRSIRGLGSVESARIIHEDGIDVLVELTGHTANNRLDVMALKPSPVSISYIGYPNTTGLPTIDYRLTDAIADPLDTSQKYTESLVRLSGCFLCYTPPEDVDQVAPCPLLRNGWVTFGSFNNLAKITSQVYDVWAKILELVPGSRFVMKCKPFSNPLVVDRVTSEFMGRGIEAHRVDLLPLAASNKEHLATYSTIDVGLDSWPYAGATTTCEAIWMGVPVITHAGNNCHAHNVGASLLSAVKLDHLVCRSPDTYIQRAVQLASDPDQLVSLRASLRQQMSTSELMSGTKHTVEVEKVYQSLWARWRSKEDGSGYNLV